MTPPSPRRRTVHFAALLAAVVGVQIAIIGSFAALLLDAPG